MATQTPTKPVEDSISKVNDEIAVGSDLDFQRRWWRFETVVWTLLTLLAVAALLGFTGRGHFAKGHKAAADGTIDVDYDRVARYGTSSVLTIRFGPAAIREGKVRLWAGESLFKELGSQKVVPQPAASAIGQGGTVMTFDAMSSPATVQFSLQPTMAGRATVQLQVPGAEIVTAPVLVMP